MRALHADKNLAPAAMQKLDEAAAQAIDGFAAAPSGDSVKAKKVARTTAYQLAH